MRVGVFGGVFNPPHIGHLVCAQEAHAKLGLDVVVWIPAGRPPHREIDDPGPELRLLMCEYAIAADERFRLSRAEVDRRGPSYMADTLRELRERAPGDELVLILGGDQARALGTWHEPEEVVRRCAAIAVAERGEDRRAAVAEALEAVPGAPERLRFFDMPQIDLASTAIRRRVAEGRPIRYLVPDKVAALIGTQGLYGAAPPASAAALPAEARS